MTINELVEKLSDFDGNLDVNVWDNSITDKVGIDRMEILDGEPLLVEDGD